MWQVGGGVFDTMPGTPERERVLAEAREQCLDPGDAKRLVDPIASGVDRQLGRGVGQGPVKRFGLVPPRLGLSGGGLGYRTQPAGFDTLGADGIIFGVTIRPMIEADLDQVMELEKAIFPNPWRRSFFLSDINRPQGLSIVAEDEGIVLGYAVAWGTEETHLANLAVAEYERCKGVGGKLLDEVIAFARRNRADSLYLEVRASNKVARKFYADRGFVPTYLRKGYYENGEDAVIMEREVEAGQV